MVEAIQRGNQKLMRKLQGWDAKRTEMEGDLGIVRCAGQAKEGYEAGETPGNAYSMHDSIEKQLRPRGL